MQNPIYNVIIYTSVVSFTFLISLVGVSTKLCVKHNDPSEGHHGRSARYPRIEGRGSSPDKGKKVDQSISNKRKRIKQISG